MRAALAFVLLCGAVLVAGAAAPVAFVADIRGNATIEGNGRLTFLAELAPGTRILLGSHASISITYAATGAEFTLTGPGEYLVMPAEVRAEKGATPKKRSVSTLSDTGVVAQASRTATASLRMRGLPPPEKKIALQFPVDTRVSTLQPAPRWMGEADGTYTLTLTDGKGKEVWKGSAHPESKLPVRLSAATRYRWTVMTAQGGLGEAHFETLPAEAIARAERSRASAANFPGRVMHAFVLQEIGATQEAREAWSALARERPDLPELSALAR
ncbi:MAG TPA: hypothetical protein VM073_05845 [Usitatibacter sp.]|nr:hypothetical protein [Usitatibacter sp.]